eukprot:scaffold34407_cov34-Attheya_sp.AAC.4
MVEALSNLLPALEVLEGFFGLDQPRVVRVRPTKETGCTYVYGDAAESCFSVQDYVGRPGEWRVIVVFGAAAGNNQSTGQPGGNSGTWQASY